MRCNFFMRTSIRKHNRILPQSRILSLLCLCLLLECGLACVWGGQRQGSRGNQDWAYGRHQSRHEAPSACKHTAKAFLSSDFFLKNLVSLIFTKTISQWHCSSASPRDQTHVRSHALHVADTRSNTNTRLFLCQVIYQHLVLNFFVFSDIILLIF